MLSIIIPTLNEERYIHNLLLSLSRQDYKNFEIIIADGISDDLTQDIAQASARDLGLNLRFIQTSVRRTAKQRNIGARAALGGKLVFIDADIQLPKGNFLSRLNQALDKKNSAVALVRVTPDDEKAIDRIISHFLNGWVMLLNMVGIPCGRGAFIGVKAGKFHKISGFDERAVIGEDVDILMRVGTTPSILRPPVYESPRRYRKAGYVKVLSSWIIDGLVFHIFKRPLRMLWRPVR